jgi:hypothetical protein
MSGKGDRPIPVRSVAPPPASTPVQPPGEAASPDPTPPEPARPLVIDGTRWDVRAVGRTRSGHGRDAGALLLLLNFTPSEGKPDREGKDRGDAARPVVREALAVGRSLDDLDDEVLGELLERSRPVPRSAGGTGTGTGQATGQGTAGSTRAGGS